IDHLGPIEAEDGAPAAAGAEAAVETSPRPPEEEQASDAANGAASPSTAAGSGATAPASTQRSRSEVRGAVARLRRGGDVWEVGFADETLRMKDVKGVHLLTMLLAHPGREIHVLDLAAGRVGPAPAAAASTGGEVVDRGDAGPLLDPTARAAY